MDTLESYQVYRTRHPSDPHAMDAQALIVWTRARSAGSVTPGLYPLLGNVLDLPARTTRPEFPSEEERAFVDSVGRSGVTATEPLLDLLAIGPDADRAMRWAVVRALGKTGDSRAVEPLIATLRDATVAALAVDSLGELGDPRAAAPLVKSMRFGPYRGSNIRTALARIGTPSVEPILTELEECPHHSTLLGMLGSFDDPRAVAALITALGNRRADARSSAARALRGHAGETAVDPLIRVLHDPEPVVRKAAVGSLGWICATAALDPSREASVVECLVLALQDPQPYVRGEAASSLCRIGGPRATEALDEALENENLAAVAGPYEYFIRLGVPGSAPVLVHALEAHGHSGMAEDYLNSGNSELSRAAADWLKKRGYRIVRIPGRLSTPEWGSATTTESSRQG